MSPLNYDNLTDADIDALAEQFAAYANGTVTTVNEDGKYPQIGPDGTDCGEGAVYRGGLGGCTSDMLSNLTDQEVKDLFTSLANSPDADFLDIDDLFNNKPPPVVEGSDGQMYLSNPQLTPNGWITDPDYSTPVYFFHQPLEAGEAREIYAEYSDDLLSANQQGYWRTEEEIKRFWEGKQTADHPGQLNMQTFREQHPNMSFETYMAFIKENSALHQQGYTLPDNPEMFSAITDKYGVKTTFTNSDGDVYGWNGSNYTKTYKVDESFDAGGLIMSLAVGAMTGGLADAGALGSFIKGLSGFQKAAVINGVTTAVQTGGDLKAIAGSVVGTFAGGQLGSYIDLGSAAANSALSSSIASAFEQGIVNGEIDVNTMLTSGLLGAGTEIAKDLVDSFVNGTGFDFGGLLSEDSDLYRTLNGAYDPSTGQFSVGLIEGARGAYNQFVEQYITGGNWWENATSSYDSVSIWTDGAGNKRVNLIGYDGSLTEMTWAEFVSAGFDEISGSSTFWNAVSGAFDTIPDSWLDKLYEWMTNAASSSGGAYSTESGATITTDDGSDDTTPSDDFDCSSINRQQVAGATTGTECGPCIQGYEVNEFEQCVETIGGQTCPEGQYYNEVTLQCEDEVSFTPGAPCNAADGEQGTYNDQGECVVPSGGGGDGTGDGTGDGGCQDPNRLVNANGECTASCQSGYELDEGQDLCVPSATIPQPEGCGPAPTAEEYGGYTFEFSAAIRAWRDECGASTCDDGTPKADDPNCNGNQPVDGQQCTTDDGQNGYYEGGVCVPVTVPVEQCSDPDRATKDDGSCAELCKDGTVPDTHEGGICGNPLTAGPGEEQCDNGATVESACSECADGTLPEDYEDGKCPSGTTTTTGGDDGGDADCTLVECESPRPEGEQGVLWDKCCSDVTTTPTGGGETDCTLVECESPRPEGDAGTLWDECCKDVTTTPSGGGGGGGFGGGGGGGMFSGAAPVDLSFDIAGDPTLLARSEFPITDFLAGIFTNSRGGRNV